MPYKKITGIYQIRNLINNKIYIGSAISIYYRFNTHKKQLIRNKHFNQHLQSAWNLQKEENFVFEILEECKKEQLQEKEEYYIQYFKSNNNQFGYNRRIHCGTNLGIKATPETREKLRKAHLGKKHPQWRCDLKVITQSKRTYQYDLNGNFLKEHFSVKNAAEELYICKVTISMCCRKKTKQAGGFMWSYVKVDFLPPYKSNN